MEIHAKRTTTWLLRGAVAAGVLVVLAACASIRDAQSMETGQVLGDAGFKMKFADTAEKRANLESLTQRKLVPHPEDGLVLYVYADAATCKCIYVGDEAAYQRYQQLAREHVIPEDRLKALRANEDGSVHWGLWGSRNSWF